MVKLDPTFFAIKVSFHIYHYFGIFLEIDRVKNYKICTNCWTFLSFRAVFKNLYHGKALPFENFLKIVI